MSPLKTVLKTTIYILQKKFEGSGRGNWEYKSLFRELEEFNEDKNTDDPARNIVISILEFVYKFLI